MWGEASGTSNDIRDGKESQDALSFPLNVAVGMVEQARVGLVVLLGPLLKSGIFVLGPWDG